MLLGAGNETHGTSYACLDFEEHILKSVPGGQVDDNPAMGQLLIRCQSIARNNNDSGRFCYMRSLNYSEWTLMRQSKLQLKFFYGTWHLR